MHARSFVNHTFNSLSRKGWGIVAMLCLCLFAGCSGTGAPVVVFPTGTAGVGVGIGSGSSTGSGPAPETAKPKWQPFAVAESTANGLDIAEANGLIYINTTSQLLALSATDGKTIKWKYAPSSSGPFQVPPVVSGNVVYDLFFGQGLYAFNATTGQQLWSANLSFFNAFDSVPAVADGLVFVNGLGGQGLQQQEEIFAVSAQSGVQVWQRMIGSTTQLDGITSPAEADGTVYTLGLNGTLYALDAHTGAVQWSYATGVAATGQTIYVSPLVQGGIVIFGAYQNGAAANQSGGVFAVSIASHKLAWQQPISPGFNSKFYAAGNTVILDSSQQTEALDLTTGRQVWALQDRALSPATVAGTTLYGEYSDFGGEGIAAYSVSGRGLWQFKPSFPDENQIIAPLTPELVVDQGNMYFGYYDGARKDWLIYDYDISSFPSA